MSATPAANSSDRVSKLTTGQPLRTETEPNDSNRRLGRITEREIQIFLGSVVLAYIGLIGLGHLGAG
jgi:hypothetical protein